MVDLLPKHCQHDGVHKPPAASLVENLAVDAVFWRTHHLLGDSPEGMTEAPQERLRAHRLDCLRLSVAHEVAAHMVDIVACKTTSPHAAICEAVLRCVKPEKTLLGIVDAARKRIVSVTPEANEWTDADLIALTVMVLREELQRHQTEQELDIVRLLDDAEAA